MLQGEIHLYSSSFPKARDRSFFTVPVFASFILSLAEITIRFPVFIGLWHIISLYASRITRFARLRTTACPSFVVAVKPIRLRNSLFGFSRRRRPAFRSFSRYTVTVSVTYRLPFVYAFTNRWFSFMANSFTLTSFQIDRLSVSKSCSTLSASSLQYLSSVCSAHSLAEAVLF